MPIDDPNERRDLVKVASTEAADTGAHHGDDDEDGQDHERRRAGEEGERPREPTPFAWRSG